MLTGRDDTARVGSMQDFFRDWTLVPLGDHPVRLLEALAEIDMISRGRLVSGVVRLARQFLP